MTVFFRASESSRDLQPNIVYAYLKIHLFRGLVQISKKSIAALEFKSMVLRNTLLDLKIITRDEMLP